MASSAFASDSLTKAYRWRIKDGMSGRVHHVPMTSSAVYRYGDILTLTSGLAVRTAACTPAGSVGVVVSGNDGLIPRYIALKTVTAGSGMTAEDTIPCLDINDVELLMRIWADVSANSTQAGHLASFGLATEYGIYEPDTTSESYFPVLDSDEVDATNGSFKVVENAIESDPADEYGLVWVAATGLA